MVAAAFDKRTHFDVDVSSCPHSIIYNSDFSCYYAVYFALYSHFVDKADNIPPNRPFQPAFHRIRTSPHLSAGIYAALLELHTQMSALLGRISVRLSCPFSSPISILSNSIKDSLRY